MSLSSSIDLSYERLSYINSDRFPLPICGYKKILEDIGDISAKLVNLLEAMNQSLEKDSMRRVVHISGFLFL